jgi:hypothetical protein
LGCTYYLIRELLGTRTRLSAELIEHPIEQGGTTFMNHRLLAAGQAYSAIQSGGDTQAWVNNDGNHDAMQSVLLLGSSI